MRNPLRLTWARRPLSPLLTFPLALFRIRGSGTAAVAMAAVALLASAAVVPAREKVAVPPPRAGTRPADSPPVEPATAPVTRPAWPPVPEATLQRMYRRELGPKYNPADAGKLYQAHQLLELYFETSKAAERKDLTAKIDALGLDPNVVGRLTRLRMYWPELDGGTVYYINEPFGPHVVRYFFGLPKDYDRTRPWPLVIRLPTANAFLPQPPAQPPDADEVVKIYSGWIKEELAHHPDAVVLMPLLNLDELYGPSYAGMNSVIQPMFHVADRVNVDPARVYMVGHSMAGHAVWNLALNYTTYFAAVNPLAGAASMDWQRLRLINLRNTLPVVWHDADDKVLNPGFSRTNVRLLREAKVDVDYDETKGVGHAPTQAVADKAYDKTRARTRELYPNQVWLQSDRPEPVYNRLDWVQVWQEINPGPDRPPVTFRYGTGHMTLNTNSYRIDAAHPRGNRFDLTTENVESLRLYLNDQMVDFAGVVTVVLNKKPKFEAMVKPSTEIMLKDQLFLGRGWRYFTGYVDVDVVPPPKSATQPHTRPVTVPSGSHHGTITVGPGAAEP